MRRGIKMNIKAFAMSKVDFLVFVLVHIVAISTGLIAVSLTCGFDRFGLYIVMVTLFLVVCCIVFWLISVIMEFKKLKKLVIRNEVGSSWSRRKWDEKK